jgi:hypothetical protein
MHDLINRRLNSFDGLGLIRAPLQDLIDTEQFTQGLNKTEKEKKVWNES